MQKFLTLDFLPRNVDLTLLLLRLWLGGSMLALHGWGKLNGLLSGSTKFPDVFGIGAMPTLFLAVLTEVLGSLFLILGLWTRPAALALAVTMAVAFALAHGMKLTGPGNGEMAFIYLAGFVALVVAGAGKYSVDRK